MKLKYLTLAALIALAGCAKSPEDTITAYYKAVAAGEQDAAIKLLHPNAMLFVGEPKVRALMQQQARRIQGCGGIADIAVSLSDATNVRKQGTAVVTYKGSCKPLTERVALVKVDDKWRITP